MSLLQNLGNRPGYLKAGFLGFQKSGKTFTAIDLAIGTRRFLSLDGPLAMFDTETGSAFIGGRVREGTGLDLVGIRSRSFDDLMTVGTECVAGGISVLVVDSVTHVWRDLCESYLKQINEVRAKRKSPPKRSLELQDWGPIKAKWSKWTEFYLNSPLHIVICGRAGYEYDFEVNDDGKKELVKTGVKMKTEGEFGYEPSLLVEMEQVAIRRGDKAKVHRATVLGDRFNLIDGAMADNPTFAFFEPHVRNLVPGAHASVDITLKTDFGIDDDGNDWRRQRAILLERIENELVRAWPGQTKDEKLAKLNALKTAFETDSWTAVSSMSVERLRKGLVLIVDELVPKSAEVAAI